MQKSAASRLPVRGLPPETEGAVACRGQLCHLVHLGAFLHPGVLFAPGLWHPGSPRVPRPPGLADSTPLLIPDTHARVPWVPPAAWSRAE